MGMTIENSIRLLEDYLEWQKLHEMDGNGVDEATRNLIDAARKYQMMQADYENRLKADMAAILEKLKSEIEELQGKYSPYYDEASQHTSELIQQKINALMERGNDGNND